MMMRHELQVLFAQIMLRVIDSALPYYVVLAGPEGIGKSLVGLCTKIRGDKSGLGKICSSIIY